ncbi:pantoate--beta-alanine ligase [Acidobacteriota bacterium]
MKTIRTIDEMKILAQVLKSRRKTVGLVPTMGYLHEGHLSLVKGSLNKTDVTVVSVFVNPTQFSPSEDFQEYPRDMNRDSEILKNLGIDYLFCPASEEMYPSNYHTFVEVHNLQNKLCGKSRPDHFRGVCTVVLKLFNIVQPDFAFFGQKDAQQIVILKKMIQDLNCDVKIIALPIVREHDGLALSSRNVYLNPDQRQAALCLHKSLQEARQMIDSGERESVLILQKMKKIIRAEPEAHIDYLAIVHAASLERTDEISDDSLIALAVFFGKVRLIDNLWIENLPAFSIDEE